MAIFIFRISAPKWIYDLEKEVMVNQNYFNVPYLSSFMKICHTWFLGKNE